MCHHRKRMENAHVCRKSISQLQVHANFYAKLKNLHVFLSYCIDKLQFILQLNNIVIGRKLYLLPVFYAYK